MLAHTSQEFEAELRQLKEQLLAMGGRCERMVHMAGRAIVEQDQELAREVIQLDRGTNSDERSIDDSAVRILALRQPVGRDLRFTITAVKVVTDLERIGDEAVNLAERAQELAELPALPPPAQHLLEMAKQAGAVLHAALDAFVHEDADAAEDVFRMDDVVDDLYGQVLMESLEFMKEHSERVPAGMRVASCAKYLERIADHATNIAEMVVFLVRGEDVRHVGKLRASQAPAPNP